MVALPAHPRTVPCVFHSDTEQQLPFLASLTDAWEPTARGDVVDWVRLRALTDYLSSHPLHVERCISIPPSPSGSDLLDNLLAGVAETLADEAGIARPPWTEKVSRLRDQWCIPGTPRTVDQARLSTPPALAARGVVISRSSIFRERT